MPDESIRALHDHTLIALAFVHVAVRWEPFADPANGELCFGGMRYATELDSFGIPRLSGYVRHKLEETLTVKG